MSQHLRLAVIIIATVAVPLAVVGTGNKAFAVVIPPSGLAPGSQYQLLFFTSGGTSATSSNIADYNAFASAQAALSPTLPTGVTWNAVVSTPTLEANNNAKNPVGIPIYNTHGIKIANGSLYSGVPLLSPVAYDQFGTAVPGGFAVWTGSNEEGAGVFNQTLGNASGIFRFGSGNVTATWLSSNSGTQSQEGNSPIFVLSSPITVPEPSSVLILLSGLLTPVIRNWFRRPKPH
jgi:hypothetical protein